MAGVELNELVSAYHKIRLVLLPMTALYTTTQHVLSWNNVPLTVTILAALVILLLYPIYLQITLILGLALVFGLGYAQNANENLDINRIKNIDPVNFINPQYYSLEPQKSIDVKRKTVSDYKEMLVELDSYFKTITSLRDSVVSLVSWRNFICTRNHVITLTVVVFAPFVFPLNLTLVMLTLFIFCCRNSSYTATRNWLIGSAVPINTQPSPFSDSSDSDTSRDMKGVSRDLPEEQADSRCSTCDILMITTSVKCGFCGCENCGECCRQSVSKARLGVTNPATKHHLVLVCNDCYSYLPQT